MSRTAHGYCCRYHFGGSTSQCLRDAGVPEMNSRSIEAMQLPIVTSYPVDSIKSVHWDKVVPNRPTGIASWFVSQVAKLFLEWASLSVRFQYQGHRRKYDNLVISWIPSSLHLRSRNYFQDCSCKVPFTCLSVKSTPKLSMPIAFYGAYPFRAASLVSFYPSRRWFPSKYIAWIHYMHPVIYSPRNQTCRWEPAIPVWYGSPRQVRFAASAVATARKVCANEESFRYIFRDFLSIVQIPEHHVQIECRKTLYVLNNTASCQIYSKPDVRKCTVKSPTAW